MRFNNNFISWNVSVFSVFSSLQFICGSRSIFQCFVGLLCFLRRDRAVWRLALSPSHRVSPVGNNACCFLHHKLAAVCQRGRLMSLLKDRDRAERDWQAIVSRMHSSLRSGSSSEGCHRRGGLIAALTQSPSIRAASLKRPSRKLKESRFDGFTSSIQHGKVIMWQSALSQTDCCKQTWQTSRI